MKNTINGILRSLIVLVALYILYMTAVIELRPEELKYHGVPPDFIAIAVLTLTVATYMSVNGIREFMDLRIRFRVLYVINALVTLIVLFGAIHASGDPYKKGGATSTDFISYVTLILMLYFSIADFIELFMKKEEEELDAGL